MVLCFQLVLCLHLVPKIVLFKIQDWTIPTNLMVSGKQSEAYAIKAWYLRRDSFEKLRALEGNEYKFQVAQPLIHTFSVHDFC